jgi:hypothetical protein
VFAGVDVLEGIITVAVLDGQTFVVLKPKFPVAFSHMVRPVRTARAALYAISGSETLRSGLLANFEFGAKVLPFGGDDVVPI